MNDFCQLCIFLTIFSFQELSWENRTYFWALLLNIDVSNDRNNEEAKKNYADYAKMSVQVTGHLDNTLRLDGVLIEEVDDNGVDLITTRYGIRSNIKKEESKRKDAEDIWKYYMPDPFTIFTLAKAWNTKNAPIDYH